MCLKWFTSAELNMEMWRHVIVVHTVVLWLESGFDSISLKLKDGSSIFPVSLSCERKVQSVSVITGWLTHNKPPFYWCIFFKMSCGIFKTEKKDKTNQPKSVFQRKLSVYGKERFNNVDMSCRKDIFHSWLDSCITTCHVSEMANLWLHSHAHKKKSYNRVSHCAPNRMILHQLHFLNHRNPEWYIVWFDVFHHEKNRYYNSGKQLFSL